MKNRTSRIMTETIVRKAIKDMQDSPKRSMRNLVDMALSFSHGRFQSHFFQAAHTMLENKNSPYYDLIEGVVRNVDPDRLVTLGMNVGYNSCTFGAEKIRAFEDTCRHNIPWTVMLQIDPNQYTERPDDYHIVIEQGEELGIFTWFLFPEENPEEVLSLPPEHPDSAFILCCEAESVSGAFPDEIATLSNLMPAVRYSGRESEIRLFRALRDKGLIYSAYMRYGPEDVENIMNDEVFYSAQELDPFFTALIPKKGCPSDIQESVAAHVRKLRSRQTLQTIPFELIHDCSQIDEIISSKPCVITFDTEGTLHSLYPHEKKLNYNIFYDNLETIFLKAFPKE